MMKKLKGNEENESGALESSRRARKKNIRRARHVSAEKLK